MKAYLRRDVGAFGKFFFPERFTLPYNDLHRHLFVFHHQRHHRRRGRLHYAGLRHLHRCGLGLGWHVAARKAPQHLQLVRDRVGGHEAEPPPGGKDW